MGGPPVIAYSIDRRSSPTYVHHYNTLELGYENNSCCAYTILFLLQSFTIIVTSNPFHQLQCNSSYEQRVDNALKA